MSGYLHFFVLIPFIGFLMSLWVPEKREQMISNISFAIVLLQFILISTFIVFWIFEGAKPLNFKELTVVETKDYAFFIDFYFDKVGAVFVWIGVILTMMVTTYSRYYLHREKGYKRFFNTILFFFFGFNLTVLSGNFETLFMGWEILGISSFLLIAFYRERYLPVKNAIKVFSLYRIGDVGIILAMWASHHLFHENITFIQLSNDQLVNAHLDSHSIIGFFISFVLVMAALVKSAQIPFSSWLPRAMEGPTPSSAIFYGSLSVHLGAFLLMRTFNFWEHQISIRVLIIIFGILSSVIATLIARVQSSVKSQIAYSSIAQIGLIFIEIALGLETLALIHIAGNAFLRTYQLLVSPSVVSYLIREQMYHFTPKKEAKYSIFTQKVYQAFYILSLKEFKLESFQNYILWKPLKKMGSLLQAFNLKTLFLVFVPVYIFGVAAYFFQAQIPAQILSYLPTSFAFIGFIMILKSFSERQSPFLSWLLIFLNHLWIVLAISFNEYVSGYELTLYLAGVFVAGIFGYIALLKLKKIEEIVNLNQYLGHVYEHPKFAFLFLLACLGMTGFPITTTFIGEDLLFSHIHSDQVFLAVFVSLSFIISGISAIRIYARLFLGPHIKSYHVRANPSS